VILERPGWGSLDLPLWIFRMHMAAVSMCSHGCLVALVVTD
jgi:hypothetical protein